MVSLRYLPGDLLKFKHQRPEHIGDCGRPVALTDEPIVEGASLAFQPTTFAPVEPVGKEHGLAHAAGGGYYKEFSRIALYIVIKCLDISLPPNKAFIINEGDPPLMAILLGNLVGRGGISGALDD